MQIESTKNLKLALKAILYLALLILFYMFYMKDALNKYKDGRTTMSEMRNKIISNTERLAPVMIICPEPGFKSSFFDEHNIDKSMKNFFWNWEFSEQWMKKFENYFLDAYMNMSYTYGVDWNMILLKTEYE